MLDFEKEFEELSKDPEYIFEGLKTFLAIQLKNLMKRKGISKKELAEKMGVSPAYVSKIFGGDNISLKVIAKVLAALDASDLNLYLLSEEQFKKIQAIKDLNFVVGKFQNVSPTLEEDNEGSTIAIAA
jgi:transcriptional regulator with XRE-family HTH domain